MKAAAVLILAGVFVGAQVLKGGVLDRLLSGSSGSSAPAPPFAPSAPGQLGTNWGFSSPSFAPSPPGSLGANWGFGTPIAQGGGS